MAAVTLFSARSVYADTPEQIARRKPIYEDDVPAPTRVPAPTKEPTGLFDTKQTPSQPSKQSTPTPTDQLTSVVREARLGLYSLSKRSEDGINNMMSRYLNLEQSFTSTIASLAPPPTANEHLLPGTVYILVAAMAGSIISRNRGFLLRFATPTAFGVGAAYTFLPVTTRNVGDLVWKYEQRYPALAKTHLQIRDRAEQIWETSKAHTQTTMDIAEQKLDEARKGVEGFVGKGH